MFSYIFKMWRGCYLVPTTAISPLCSVDNVNRFRTEACFLNFVFSRLSSIWRIFSTKIWDCVRWWRKKMRNGRYRLMNPFRLEYIATKGAFKWILNALSHRWLNASASGKKSETPGDKNHAFQNFNSAAASPAALWNVWLCFEHS